MPDRGLKQVQEQVKEQEQVPDRGLTQVLKQVKVHKTGASRCIHLWSAAVSGWSCLVGLREPGPRLIQPSFTRYWARPSFTCTGIIPVP